MDELLSDFLADSYEGLDRLDQQFVNLEENPTDSETLASIFRSIHSIKGGSGILGFHNLESVSHVGESLLSKLREGELLVTRPITDGLLAMVDVIRILLDQIEKTGKDEPGDYSTLIEVLDSLQRVEISDNTIELKREAIVTDELSEVRTNSSATVDVKRDSTRVPGIQPVEDEDKSAAHFAGQATSANKANDNTIRVAVDLLDSLMNLVGELVLARNQVLQCAGECKFKSLTAASQRLNLITSELQDRVMQTRMQPISNLWNKLPRMVRDVAKLCGKQVRLILEGQNTELDRTIIEAIKDPLTHILRNSIDHGIEKPEERVSKSKPVEGTLFLRAYHEGGCVNIEINDDGRGIDIDQVKRKVVEKGLVSADRVSRLSDQELANLVFLPGFSTAESITTVSGRGVGMDVVRTNIEEIGGTIELNSKRGEGTSLKIKIPLTLAIIPALLVTACGEQYAIPQINLLELVCCSAERDIENLHGTSVYRLRGKLLPLVFLSDSLELIESQSDGKLLNIVVLQANGEEFGLVVDEVTDTCEIVVKPLGLLLNDNPLFAGATILGNGDVALILDIFALAKNSQLNSSHEGENGTSKSEIESSVDDLHSYLMVQLTTKRRAAISIDNIQRLEEIRVEQIEHVGDQPVVQYEDDIMPILHWHDAGFEDFAAHRELQVVVSEYSGRPIGLVVDQIMDVVRLSKTSTSAGMGQNSSNRLIDGMITEILDLKEMIGDFSSCLSPSLRRGMGLD